MISEKPKFNNGKDRDFVQELRQRVEAYFKENGLSKHANGQMVWKTVILFVVTFGAYFVILLGGLPGWAMLGLCVVMGAGFAAIGFNVGHDALHGAYSSNRQVNKWLGMSFNLLGANDYFWKIKHNVRHHTYTNIYEHDEDLEVASYLRFSPNAPFKPVNRFQHVTAFVSYSALTLAWIFFTDYAKLKLYNGNGSPNPEVKHPRNEVVKLFVTKAFYMLYTLVIPYLVLGLPWWQILTGFVVMHLTTGLILSMVFQMAHIVEETEHPLPAGGTLESAWMVHQMQTTANFATGVRWLTWFVGGLNFQVEHHLFPQICSIHYPQLSPIVKETAEKYNVRYHDENSFGSAVVSHYRVLRQLSRP